MDIEEFIQTTLTQIIDGVKKAQVATLMVLKKHKTLPALQGGPEEDADMVKPRVMYIKGTHYATVNRNIVHIVDFDITVTSDSSSDAGGKLALKITGIGGIEGGWRSVNRNTIVSRVKFQIPSTLPLLNQTS